MYPSLRLCRAQEAHQRDRAASALLDNVRVVATKAANAWALEGIAAERREDRRTRMAAIAETITADQQATRSDDDDDSDLSEAGLHDWQGLEA